MQNHQNDELNILNEINDELSVSSENKKEGEKTNNIPGEGTQ